MNAKEVWLLSINIEKHFSFPPWYKRGGCPASVFAMENVTVWQHQRSPKIIKHFSQYITQKIFQFTQKWN
jgi:hypothetical protein